MKYTQIREGATELLVPTVSLNTPDPPTTPIFFNPAASINRDVSVAITQTSRGRTFCDSLAGIGSRGVRIANEVGREMAVTMVDFSVSLRLARRNARLNSVDGRCGFEAREANEFLYSRFRRDDKYGYVDVDPFGTPAPYLQSAFHAVEDGGIVSVTATDSAVLCGVYPEVARRRYWSLPRNNEYAHETGLRILINACMRLAGSIDIGVQPVAAHSTRHYMRVYIRAMVGASKADRSVEREGYLAVCSHCHNAGASPEPSTECQFCGSKARVAGPLWLGGLVDDGLAASAAKYCEKKGFREAGRILASLVGSDSMPPYSFSLERICSALKVASVPERRVVEILEGSGFRCHSQPFEVTGLKTDARYDDVAEAVRLASEARADPSSRRRSSRAPRRRSG